MARITAKKQKIFCSAADADQIAAFATAKTGTPVYSTDPDVLQTAEYTEGWKEATLNDYAPYREEMNGVQYGITRQLAYWQQEGVNEWLSNVEYYKGSFCKVIDSDGVPQVYYSLQDSNINNLPSDTTYWVPYNTVDTSDFVHSNVAVTHTQNTAAGTSILPVYVTSTGVATACSGIDTTKLCCTSKATTTSSASTTKPAVITQNYVNDTSWYRVWSDGWIEQGGYLSVTSSSATVSLLKSHANTNYNITLGGYQPTVGAGYVVVISETKKSFVLDCTGLASLSVWWRTAGY